MTALPTAPPVTRRKLLLFCAFASVAVCVEWAITRTPAFQHASALPLAVLFDLVVVLPLAFGVALLRPAGRSLFEAAPVLALGAFLAGILLAPRLDMKLPLRIAGACAELAVLAQLARRLHQAKKQIGETPSDDLLERVGALSDPVLRVAGAELLVLYYAFVGPFVRRPLQPNELGYTENSGLGGLLFALAFVTSMESLVVHLLVAPVAPRAAWVFSALSAYTILWLAAAYQAARLRPVVLTRDHLLVRTSLLWTAAIPRDAIASVTAIEAMPHGRHLLWAALGTAPVVLVTTNRPVTARGPFGIRKTVRGVALYVDDPAKLAPAEQDTLAGRCA